MRPNQHAVLSALILNLQQHHAGRGQILLGETTEIVLDYTRFQFLHSDVSARDQRTILIPVWKRLLGAASKQYSLRRV